MHHLASSTRLSSRSSWGRGDHTSKLRAREDIHPASAFAVVLTLCGAVLWTTQAQAAAPSISVAEDADHNVVLTVKGDRAPTFQIYEARQKAGASPRFVVELPGSELKASAPLSEAPAVVYEGGTTYAKRARSAPRVELSFFSSVDYNAATKGNALVVTFVPLDDKETLLAAHQRRVDSAKRIALAQKQSAEEKKRQEALEKKREAEEKIRLAALEEQRKEAAAREAERLLREQQALKKAARLAALEKQRKEAERLAKLEQERKRKEAERVARLEAERKAKLEAERKRKEAERLAKIEAERKRKEAERLARIEEERQRNEAARLAKIEAERKRQAAARKEAERLAKIEEERKRKEAARLAKLEEERKRIEAERKEAQRLAQIEAERKRKEAERLAKIEAERKRIEAERKEAQRLAQIEAERKRKEAERLAKVEAERKRIEAERKEAERRAKLEEERQREEAARLAKIEAERKRQEAERRRLEEQRRQEQERARLAEAQRAKERERLAQQRRRQAQEIEARRRQSGGGRQIEVASASRQGFGFGGTRAVDIGGPRGLYRLADAPRVRQDAFGGGGDDGDGPRGVLSRVTVRREARDKSAVGIRVDGGARYSVSRRSSNELVLTLFDTEAQSLTVRRILDARDLRTSILRVLPHVEEDIRHRVELVIELRGSGAARVTEEDEMLWLHIES